MGEGYFSRGFRGRRRSQDTTRPPGQYLEDGFPVLSAGPTPHTPLEEWDFSIVGEVDKPKKWTWEEFKGPRHPRLLGIFGLPQLRRPLARAALLGGRLAHGGCTAS
jgi:hypothetical protein